MSIKLGLFKIKQCSYGCYLKFLNQSYLGFFHVSTPLKFGTKFIRISTHKWKLWFDNFVLNSNQQRRETNQSQKLYWESKIFSNSLLITGNSIIDQDQINLILNMLPKEYGLFVMPVYGFPVPPTFCDKKHNWTNSVNNWLREMYLQTLLTQVKKRIIPKENTQAIG